MSRVQQPPSLTSQGHKHSDALLSFDKRWANVFLSPEPFCSPFSLQVYARTDNTQVWTHSGVFKAL